MNKSNEYNIFWTLIWLIFIGFLCYIFDTAYPLCLLILWIFGLKCDGGELNEK